MELIFALALFGTGVLMFAGIRGMKPETAAQRRARLYRDAAREDRQFHRIQEDVYDRMAGGHGKRKRAKYKPSKARIHRRMRDMEQEYARA